MCSMKLIPVGIASLLFLAPPQHSIAADCNPRDFANLDYSKYNQYERLVLLSALSDEKIKEMKVRHQGEMTIPYINVPASGDTSYVRTVTEQLKRLLTVDLTSESETTIITSRFDQNSSSMYFACVQGSRAWITLEPSGLYSAEAVLVINWKGERGVSAKISAVKMTNGEVVGDYNPDVLDDGGSLISIKRANLYEPSTVTVLVNGRPAAITLPARPSKTIETIVQKFPEKKVKSESYHGNGYIKDTRSGSYSAPPGTEILHKSPVITDEIYLNQANGCEASVQGLTSAKVTCISASPQKGVGLSAEAFGFVTVLRAIPVGK